MEKMSIFFFIIIIIYLTYAFIQSRKSREKKDTAVQQDTVPSPQPFFEGKGINEDEVAAVAAVIAAIMGDAAYRIKRVYVTATVDEKKSSWKISGRNESMMRRVFFK